MEIHFDPTRINKPEIGSSQPARRGASPTVPAVALFQNTAALESKLQDIPLARPEMVARAKTLVSDVQYPPEELMNRISNLLALHLKP